MSNLDALAAKVTARLGKPERDTATVTTRKVTPTVKVTPAERAITKSVKDGKACRVCTIIDNKPRPHNADRFHTDTNETELLLLAGSTRRTLVNGVATVA